jgi:hypothetical protein
MTSLNAKVARPWAKLENNDIILDLGLYVLDFVKIEHNL